MDGWMGECPPGRDRGAAAVAGRVCIPSTDRPTGMTEDLLLPTPPAQPVAVPHTSSPPPSPFVRYQISFSSAVVFQLSPPPFPPNANTNTSPHYLLYCRLETAGQTPPR